MPLGRLSEDAANSRRWTASLGRTHLLSIYRSPAATRTTGLLVLRAISTPRPSPRAPEPRSAVPTPGKSPDERLPPERWLPLVSRRQSTSSSRASLGTSQSLEAENSSMGGKRLSMGRPFALRGRAPTRRLPIAAVTWLISGTVTEQLTMAYPPEELPVLITLPSASIAHTRSPESPCQPPFRGPVRRGSIGKSSTSGYDATTTTNETMEPATASQRPAPIEASKVSLAKI